MIAEAVLLDALEAVHSGRLRVHEAYRTIRAAEEETNRALIVAAWDDGNATGLDGWEGAGIGARGVDAEAERRLSRFVETHIKATS